MNNFNFPVFKTKIDGKTDSFLLEDPIERKKYFEYKSREDIEKIREFLRDNSFLAFLLGPKNSGKGTYSKLFAEAIGSERIAHISVGDLVREVHKNIDDAEEKKSLYSFLEENYRGPLSIDEAIDALLGRNTTSLLPTEFILALLKREMGKVKGKAIFVDGFPRNLDQVSYSLYFRSLMGYEENPDFFVFIDVPDSIIGERMKNRVVCPICHAPRSISLFKTKEVRFDKEKGEFYLVCDEPACNKERLVAKEGDSMGIETIRDRIEIDKAVMKNLIDMQGITKIYLRNAIPVESAKDNVDDYEITPTYRYEYDESNNTVKTNAEPWIVNNDAGEPSYSLLPAAVVTGLIKQIRTALGL